MENKIITRRSKSASTIAIIIAIASLALCFVHNISLAFVGLTIFAIAIIWFFAGCKEQIAMPARVVVKKDEKLYKNEDLQKVRNIFATKDFKQLTSLQSETYGGCKVCRWYSKDGSKQFAQLYVYTPHTYKPETEVIEIK